MKLRIAILLRSVFGGYLFNSHAQTTASISSMLIFQILFELLLQLPQVLLFFYTINVVHEKLFRNNQNDDIFNQID